MPSSTQLQALRAAMEDYSPLSERSFHELSLICRHTTIDAGSDLYPVGIVPRSFAFVESGLLRATFLDSQGVAYDKIFFELGSFPGSMVALLTGKPSHFNVQAIEVSSVLEIDFQRFRALLERHHDLALFQVRYLERNWVINKEAREVSLATSDATKRYEEFLTQHPGLAARLPQFMVASHLGITPTQLSRIRAKLSQNQQM